MSKHRLQKNNRLTRGMLLGAITVGAVLIPVAPAMAQPLSIPGLGNIEIPGLPPAGAISPNAVVSHGQRALDAAQTKIGAPYVWGATGPDSFDCSGLVQWAYRQAGVSVPRTTYDQINGGTPVGKGDLQPGDVVLFYGTEHVGLYAGGGMVVHAPTPGQSVKRAPLDSMPFTAARRY
ncbi:C40 family peptidase [Rhodococcus sp. UNC363MFTsu5.1]|uniref:C40 family peptidase n=1 Tax=Rhodococcus sp. UNC363MFTsu5.1 TaxID=1449069 RepID=UPI00048155F8|nr:C40 family peptidase [Rhodococcus sp. UNC363MFTsu5.1]